MIWLSSSKQKRVRYCEYI